MSGSDRDSNRDPEADDALLDASGDHLQRVLLEDANARCVVVRLERTLADVLERGAYAPSIARLLAETLVVTALCSSGIKFRGRISLQLRSAGPLTLLMADCTDDGGLRGLARVNADPVPATADLRELAEDGVLTMTLEPSDRGQTYQGIVPMAGGGMASAIEGYFEQSEQLETRILLAVDGVRAAGVMLQKLPGDARDPDGWTRAGTLLETLAPGELLELDAETLLHRLFHEEQRRLFPARPLRFECPCTRERVASVLRGLGEDELREIVATQGEVDVDCQFCNQAYHFDRLDLERLLLSEDPEAPDGGSVH
ncbi:Hsp33 family molecular chaperone HslO [Halomonas denitrificans]|nr:Hsp33 family molecular chaperone HslO [Halomonas denitrificans]